VAQDDNDSVIREKIIIPAGNNKVFNRFIANSFGLFNLSAMNGWSIQEIRQYID
jgi:hypothetical protein